jgi:uncharacterized protein
LQKVLETLIHLQKIDKQLQHLEAERGDLPQKVEELNSQVNDAKKDLNSKIEKKESLTSEKASLDNDVVLLSEQLKKYKIQLYQVKTNKEYDAITLEIETSEKIKEEKEFRSLELEESASRLGEEIKEDQTQLESLEASFEENKKELEQKLEKTQKQQGELEEKRSAITQELKRPILAAYNRIRVARGGAAVSQLVSGACDECSSRVPPQKALEIRMMNRINYCEVCGRIVVWTPEVAKPVE